MRSCEPRPKSSSNASARGASSGRAAAGSICGRARSGQAGTQHAPLRRPVDRRHGLAFTARSRKCAPAKAKRSLPRCLRISTLSPATACTSSRSTTTLLNATPIGWARSITFSGLTVGVNLSADGPRDKQAAYAADITYGTNNEFGFDYLRDNMVYQTGDRVQRKLDLRHRRRGRLDLDRRGAHAADHLRAGGRHHRPVLQDQRSGAQAHAAKPRRTGRAISVSMRRRIKSC